ncbi:SAM-dependent methyltransferase [Marinovum sp. F03]|uniref:SAM-dependent methyltransferase n=1 Tax=Marinovum sp. F03 TaxID=3449226 RepID=UPI003EDC46B4
MIKDLWLIGIGTGSPAHVTLEGMQALREAAIILLPLKGDDKQDLAALRYAILEAAGSDAEILHLHLSRARPGAALWRTRQRLA